MTLYYFDLRVGDELYPDEEGLELPDLRAAQAEAASALAEMAREQARDADKLQMAVEVRTADDGPLFRAAFIFELSQMKH